jgi:hypothetical protein
MSLFPTLLVLLFLSTLFNLLKRLCQSLTGFPLCRSYLVLNANCCDLSLSNGFLCLLPIFRRDIGWFKSMSQLVEIYYGNDDGVTFPNSHQSYP